MVATKWWFVKQLIDFIKIKEDFSMLNKVSENNRKILFLLIFFSFCQTIVWHIFLHVFPNGTKFHNVFCWTSWLPEFFTPLKMTSSSTNDGWVLKRDIIPCCNHNPQSIFLPKKFTEIATKPVQDLTPRLKPIRLDILKLIDTTYIHT